MYLRGKEEGSERPVYDGNCNTYEEFCLSVIHLGRNIVKVELLVNILGVQRGHDITVLSNLHNDTLGKAT